MKAPHTYTSRWEDPPSYRGIDLVAPVVSPFVEGKELVGIGLRLLRARSHESYTLISDRIVVKRELYF